MVEHIKITPVERLKVWKTLIILSKQSKEPVLRVRKIIETAISCSWAQAWEPGNLEAQWKWQQYFPGDYCPTVDEFIVTMARETTAGREPPYLLG